MCDELKETLIIPRLYVRIGWYCLDLTHPVYWLSHLPLWVSLPGFRGKPNPQLLNRWFCTMETPFAWTGNHRLSPSNILAYLELLLSFLAELYSLLSEIVRYPSCREPSLAHLRSTDYNAIEGMKRPAAWVWVRYRENSAITWWLIICYLILSNLVSLVTKF